MSTVVTLGPVGFKPTGAYDNTREYKKLDVVIYQGSCYIAKSDSIGQLPTNTTYWELLVQKGDTGNGITSIAKTGTSGLVDTYTITYTDETTSTFTVTNGEKGDPGEVTQAQLDETNNQVAKANMVYNALPKVSDEGDSLTLDGTANCPMKMELKGNTEQTLLPSGYTQVDYIESSGTQYINTLFKPNNNTRVDIDFEFTHISNDNQTVVGVRTNAQSNHYGITKGASYDLYSGYGYENALVSNIVLINTRYHINKNKQNLYINDVLIHSFTQQSFQSNDNMFIFAMNQNNATTFFSELKLYSCKIYDNGILIRDYKPCKRVTDNEVGLYDLVNKQFYTNQGTSIFTYGSVVPNPDPNPDYPQDVRVVTGNNTIIVSNSDNTQSAEYPINLGTMELCKIGDYQDYIYKDNGKWYKHSEIGKIVLDGSEAWGSASSVVSGTTRFYTSNNSVYNSKNSIDTNIYILSNKFKGISWGAIYGTDTTTKNAISNYNNESSTEGRIILRIDNNIASTIETLRAYLSNNNIPAYYVLATPTNTEITDTTLISQLNAIENAVSYDTQTNIVQEYYSEPFIINVECVRSLKDIFELIQ